MNDIDVILSNLLVFVCILRFCRQGNIRNTPIKTGHAQLIVLAHGLPWPISSPLGAGRKGGSATHRMPHINLHATTRHNLEMKTDQNSLGVSNASVSQNNPVRASREAEFLPPEPISNDCGKGLFTLNESERKMWHS